MKKKNSKPEKRVFVIMPFGKTPWRDKHQLKSFFETHIKKAIEEVTDLDSGYKVELSDDTFNITDQIIRDLYGAEIVIADLSGEYPNPNVMYELGVRLTLSDKPVILIRENNPKNQKVFDVEGYYTHPFDALDIASCKKLEKRLIKKIKEYETGEETFESPVKKALYGKKILSVSAIDNWNKMRKFCERVEGHWWQRIEEEDDKGPMISISFTTFEPDEVTGELRIRGDTFDDNGKFLGKWNSQAVGIQEDEKTIQYFWKAKLPGRKPGLKSKGFGEFNFEGDDDKFSFGSGEFMNTHITDQLPSWWKSVSLRRITEEEDIRKMQEGNSQEKKDLVRETIRK